MITVVTTCNKKGFEEYGHRMFDTFERYWARDIKMLFYNEDMDNSIFSKYSSITPQHFPRWFLEWKTRYKDHADANGRQPKKNRDHRTYDFKRDCLRFAHKVAALTDAAMDRNDELLIWIDADTLAHAAVDEKWLYSLFPGDSYMAWLKRDRGCPECGFLMFRCWDSAHKKYMNRMLSIYESGEVFSLPETHDSFVFQHVAQEGVKAGWMTEPFNLSGKASRFHHPFIMCELGARLDHAKGARKKLGRTSKVEVQSTRREAYWK